MLKMKKVAVKLQYLYWNRQNAQYKPGPHNNKVFKR